jgi:uncharacterized membrane protein
MSKAHSTSDLGLERIVFFSDAVIAIAITLLVLDIKLPEIAGEAGHVLGPRMLELLPKVLGYLVSFWVIALYWVAHHRCFRYITGYDRRSIYLNFLFLMFIAFMPFPTALLFNSPVQLASVVLYALTAAGMGMSLAGLWGYAVRRRFILADTSRAVIRDVRLNLLLPTAVFVLSAVVALLNAGVAMLFWLLLVPVYLFRRHTETVLADEEQV